ncbi:MAG: DUF192 domain-containing protein [Anaerolineae bacterium]
MHLVNRTRGTLLARRVEVCDTFWTRSRGLMFRRALDEDEALWFQLDRPGRWTAAIHMFFVFFPIGVVWLDREGRVVDMALAKPFRPWYAPARPAAVFIEGHPAILTRCQAGDLLALEP